MASNLQGYSALQAKFHALEGMAKMDYLATITVGKLKKNIKHKTSNTSRSIHVAQVTETTARIEGNAVASYLDTGTGIHGPRHRRITPKVKKAMSFAVGGPSKVRLTGSSRTSKGKALAAFVVVRSTEGMKAQPYVQKSLGEARADLGTEFGAQVIETWNKAS